MDNMEGEFSREFKKFVASNRYSDWDRLEEWLVENKIIFKKSFDTIEIDDIKIYDNMKVSFGKSKRYQYNLEGIKKRLDEKN
jgi:hypothetical protein